VQKFIRYNFRVKSKPRQKRSKSKVVDWQPAPDIDKRIKKLIERLELSWLEKDNIHGFRSRNTKTRASARIWGLPRIWQKALHKSPSYVIEVISEKFDKLTEIEQDKILLHELVHIPKNFSGSLIPHYRKGKRNFQDKVKVLVNKYMKAR